MFVPPLSDRLNRLIDFSHQRSEQPLTDTQIAIRTADHGVSAVAVAAARSGQPSGLNHQQLAAIGRVLGLLDPVYLTPDNAVVDDAVRARILDFHDRLDLMIEARTLGIQHIATRNVDQDPRLIPKLRAALAAMKAPPSTR